MSHWLAPDSSCPRQPQNKCRYRDHNTFNQKSYIYIYYIHLGLYGMIHNITNHHLHTHYNSMRRSIDALFAICTPPQHKQNYISNSSPIFPRRSLFVLHCRSFNIQRTGCRSRLYSFDRLQPPMRSAGSSGNYLWFASTKRNRQSRTTPTTHTYSHISMRQFA